MSSASSAFAAASSSVSAAVQSVSSVAASESATAESWAQPTGVGAGALAVAGLGALAALV